MKALLRIAVLYNVPTACNRATADFIVGSPLFHGAYDRLVDDFGGGGFRGDFAKAFGE